MALASRRAWSTSPGGYEKEVELAANVERVILSMK
jgi:hypothetical protein